MSWTPCSKELPKRTGKYCVTVNDSINPKKRAVGISLFSKQQNKFLYGDVIAWQPLTKPFMEDLK